MKQILSFVFLLWFFNTWSQSSNIIRTTAPITTQAAAIVAPLAPPPNSIWFDYDDAGNQVDRKPIYLASPRPGRPTTPKPEEPVAFVESDIYSDVLYYPNPTIEMLNVKWKNDAETFVSDILVYNLFGQLMGTLALDRNSEQIEVDFRAYPTGMYELVLAYSNSKKKTLKIIKK